MKVPNYEKAIIHKEKVRGYLLSDSHPIGRFKAAFFQQLGYSASAWEIFENDIRRLLEKEVVKTIETEFGTKYEVRGELVGPSARTAMIVTVWVVSNGDEIPRLVTAYPGEK